MGNKDSHIQIPESVLADFSQKVPMINNLGKPENPNMVYKMDMLGDISRENIKHVNTNFGYYEDHIEQDLLAKVEALFGMAKDKLIKIAKGRTIKLLQKDVDVIKLYCSLSLIRSPEFVQEVRKKSELIDLVENSPQNTILYTFFYHARFDNDFLNGYNMFIVKNMSSINFILPQMGIIGIRKTKLINEFFIPITPKLAILFSNDNPILENTLCCKTIDDINVDNLNKFAISGELKHNKCAVYAIDKKDLERYKNFLLDKDSF